MATRTEPREAMVAREDLAFPWFIGAALAVAVGAGFVLAVLLPLAAALGWDWGSRWRALAQVHGHLQLVGWLGLFIAGMAFRLAPRFAGRSLRAAGLTTPTLVLLLAGMLGRAIAQPWLDQPAVPALLRLSALLELAGALLFAGVLIATLAPATGRVAPAALFVVGAGGLVLQALLGVVWLAPLSAERPFIPPDRDSALLSVQFFGFVLPFVIGVSLRALPTFFKYPRPSAERTLILASALALGSAVYAAGPVVEGEAGLRLRAAGALLLAATVAGAIALTGVWRAPERLRPSARPAALLVRTAYAWLALTALALAVTAVRTLARDRLVPPSDEDAIRHMLALGVFTTLLVGMAYLMLPWLAMRRQRPSTARIEIGLLWGLLTAATLLRVGGALLESRGVGAERYWPMALGGVLALVAVACFALVVLGAARRAPPEVTLYEQAPS